MIESDGDIRQVAADADRMLDSDAFKGLFVAIEAALAEAYSLLGGAIAVGGGVTVLLRRKLR
ncbi:MAG: hypothetical protein LBB62_00280, partial [Proteiniphilum sp.]|nr:hypothetical protein [Proteiniphilum sp.]